MSQSESTVAFDRPLFSHGGARAGAGRPPEDRKSEDQKDLDKAKAEHEWIKVENARLDLGVKTGSLVSRDGVKAASATALATLAQGLRSIPDNLERKLNVAPALAEAIGREIDEVLNGLADSFEMLSGPPPSAVEPDA